MIDVFNLRLLSLAYSNVTLPSLPTFSLIYELFGPTYPGRYEEELGVYILQYRGICFAFPIAEEFQHLYTESDRLPMELPDGSSPVADRMFVLVGSSVEKPQMPPMKASCFEKVCVVVTDNDVSISLPRKRCHFHLGSYVQRIYTNELGSPCQICFKKGG